MLSTETQQAITAISNNYARRYYTLDRRDMEQEAALAALESAHTWRPFGAPLSCYQARAAALAVRQFGACSSCPVPMRAHRVDALWGLTSVSYEHAGHLTDPDASPESHLYRNRLAAEIRRILYGLPDGHLAGLVLLDEYKPAEVARQQQVKLKRVYRATTRARQALAASTTLREYAAEAA